MNRGITREYMLDGLQGRINDLGEKIKRDKELTLKFEREATKGRNKKYYQLKKK